MEEGRMHYSITRSASSPSFEVTDILALTTTREEKTLKRLARSLGESYGQPAEPGRRGLRNQWKEDLYRKAAKRKIFDKEGEGFRVKREGGK